MKSKILSLIALMVMTFGLASCHDNIEPGTPETESGQVNLRSLSVDVLNAETIIESSTRLRAASRAAIDLSDFQVNIYKAGVLVKNWRYADMPELFSLEPGEYTVKVVSHDVQKAEWEKPLFVGEKTFTIANDQITEIGVVTCKLANIKVSIVYDKSLLDLLTKDDAKITVIANDEGSLEYLPNETRAGYFEALPGSSTLVATFTGTIKRNFETMRHVLNDVQAGQHRIITFKVKDQQPQPGESGGISIGDGLYLDVDVVDVDLKYSITLEEDNIPDDRPSFGGDEGGGEDPGPDPGPDDKQITVTSETLSLEGVNRVSEVSEAIVNIHSEKGIEHFVVNIETTNDNFLQAVSELMPTSFDLAYPGEYEESFASIGFPVGNQVIGAKDLAFDITTFVPLLQGFAGTHKFTLSVTDSASYQKIVSLTFLAE